MLPNNLFVRLFHFQAVSQYYKKDRSHNAMFHSGGCGKTVSRNVWLCPRNNTSPKRPLVNMGYYTSSEFYKLPKATLKDLCYNAMFHSGGCGFEMLPTTMKIEYEIHIYTFTPDDDDDRLPLSHCHR